MQTTKIEAQNKRPGLVHVPFHGDTLDATRDASGRVWVSLRRCCDNLGLAVQSQLTKLKGKAWACVTEIVMQAPGDTQSRAHACIDLETLPGWLFSIDARKVAEGAREKLSRYQREAARVLAEHFIYGKDGTSAVARSEYDALVTRCNELMRLIEWARPELPDPSRTPQTLEDRLRAANWLHIKPAHRELVGRLAALKVELRTGQKPDQERGGWVFRGPQIDIADEAIRDVANALRERRQAWAARIGT